MSHNTECISVFHTCDQEFAFGWYGHMLPICFQRAVGNIGSLVVPVSGRTRRISVPISRGRPPTC